MLEHEIYDWLKERGIHVPDYRVFGLKEELTADVYPVALKIESANVVHKSDVGGVMINLKDREELNRAGKTILGNLADHGISPTEKDKFLVSRMHTGIELFFGIVNDPVFEKVIVFGAGGIFTELFRDVCFIDSEAGDEEIKKAIAQTKIGSLFTKGFRGKKYDLQRVVDFVKKLQPLEIEEMDLNPVILDEDTLTVVDARLLHKAVPADPKPLKCLPELFAPGSIAIVGISSHPGKVGYALAKNTAQRPEVCYVNPGFDELFGKKVYRSIEDLPVIDTAIIAIPAPAVREAIQKLIKRNVKNIIVITAGFKESGQDETFLAQAALTNHLNIIGPNCLGIYVNGINLTFGTSDIQPGRANLFSQSGAIVAELMDKAALKNIGFENVVSVGNMADVDFGDLINSYTGNNPINLYIEGIAHGKNLLRAVRRARVPLKVFKAGRSEVAKKAAFSHTGNMAGNYEMFIGLLQSAGVQMIGDVNGLLYAHHFEKILVITNAGGAGTVISDLISDKLYQLNPNEISELSEVLPPQWSKNNPVDIIGDADHARYLKALTVVDRFGADAIYVIVTPQFMTDVEKISELFVENRFRTRVFPILLGGEMMDDAKLYLQKHKIDFFSEINEAVSFL